MLLKTIKLLKGVVSFAFSVILGITSLPSVAAVMSWKEFTFVQSKLGWVCLLFAIAHDVFYGWPYFFTTTCYLPPTFNVRICFIFLHSTPICKIKLQK